MLTLLRSAYGAIVLDDVPKNASLSSIWRRVRPASRPIGRASQAEGVRSESFR